MRAIGELEARLLAGTEGASSPFFSNDGRWIGFFTSVGGGGGELKKVPIGGGAATALCRYTGNAAGASWGSDDSIVFATTDLTTGLFRVPAAGGQPKALTTPDRSRGEIDHRFPLVLPGANAVVYSLANADNYHLATLDLDTGQQRLLIPGRNAQYSDSGHLVYAVDQTLHAIRFDLDSLQVNGEPVPVLQDVRLSQAVLAATDFSVSRNGALVYVPGAASQPEAPRSLVWVTRKGTEEPINAPPRAYVIARISPDGGKVALDVREQQADIYIWDLERESFSRLTTDQRNDRNPLWMPDGERIVFASNRGAGSLSLFWQRADGIGQAERLATANGFMVPTSVSPDGKRIAVMENLDITVFSTEPRAATGAAPAHDSSALPKAESERRSAPLLATAFNEDNAEISPNGEWLAYQSNEAGQPQIYVRSFPDVNRFRMQVTTAGGRTPAWSRDGRELFYLDANNRLTSVQVQTGKTFGAGKPITVLTKAYYPGFVNRSYDVSPDGQRFLMIKETAVERPTAAPAGFVVVLNWQEELNRLVPR
jgi:serine/threonine-protein kinase